MDYATAGHRPAKVLIDECLSPTLALLARRRGLSASTHVRWIGLGGLGDWRVVGYAIEQGFALVTNNRTDFTRLMAQEQNHPGLICINVAHGRNSLHVQQKLFAHALNEIGTERLPGSIFDVTLDTDGKVRITGSASRRMTQGRACGNTADN